MKVDILLKQRNLRERWKERNREREREEEWRRVPEIVCTRLTAKLILQLLVTLSFLSLPYILCILSHPHIFNLHLCIFQHCIILLWVQHSLKVHMLALGHLHSLPADRWYTVCFISNSSTLGSREVSIHHQWVSTFYMLMSVNFFSLPI